MPRMACFPELISHFPLRLSVIKYFAAGSPQLTGAQLSPRSFDCSYSRLFRSVLTKAVPLGTPGLHPPVCSGGFGGSCRPL